MTEVCICPSAAGNLSPELRQKRRRHSTAARKALNSKSSARQLTRMLYENFHPSDWFVTLTYDTEHLPGDRVHVLRNFNYFANKMRKLGEFRYIYCIEHAHGSGRWHIHLVMSPLADYETLRELWGRGNVLVNTIRQSKHENLEAIAQYMTKDRMTPEKLGKRKWTASHNLSRPDVAQETVDSVDDIDIPAEARELERTSGCDAFGSYVYVRFVVPDNVRSGGKRKRK